MSKPDQIWLVDNEDFINRYAGDDALLAYDYRLALQLILDFRITLLEAKSTTAATGPDAPVIRLIMELTSDDYTDLPVEDDPLDAPLLDISRAFTSFVEFQECISQLAPAT